MEPSNCYICNRPIDAKESYRLSAKTTYSDTIIHDLLQSFLKDTHLLRFSAYDCICKECYRRLNKYDFAYGVASSIQQHIVNAFFVTELESADEQEEIVFPDSENEIEYLGPEFLVDEENVVAEHDTEQLTTLDNDVELNESIENGTELCGNCTAKFATKKELEHHRIKVHKAKRCGICQEIFPNPKELRTHTRRIHEIAENTDGSQSTSNDSDNAIPLSSNRHCPMCGIIVDESELHSHKASHDDSWKCAICGMVLKNKGNLVMHTRIHMNKDFFRCNICEKTFVHKSSLRMHLQTTHSNVKNKTCPLCPMAFKQTSHLNQHLVTHTGEKKHECPVCGKAFSQKYNMTAHHRTAHLAHQQSPK